MRLFGGAPEPLYLPIAENRPDAGIYFRNDYAASALHELAHWCQAGKLRRELEDYGYWYEGTRNACQQKKFEQVEVRPQAIEWILSIAAGLRFRISTDNVLVDQLDVEPFRRCVASCAIKLVRQGLPPRAGVLAISLASGMPDGCETFASERHYQKLPDR